MKTLKFVMAICILLSIPAVVYLASVARHNDLNLPYLSRWFLGNYGYMAAPHLLTVIFGIAAKARRNVILWSLVTLNVLLIAFQLWIWFEVPPRESGLAWVIYLPLWALTLGSLPFFLAWIRRRDTHQ